MTHQEIREKFLNFFQGKNHKLVKSSSLLPENDPSVLLTTAGVQQFKPYFAGIKIPQEDFGTTDLVSIQKCFRTTDIDEVGDSSHLTFFEMLGNFSIGGYGKREAIQYAWEFLTKELGIAAENLIVTVFEGEFEIPEDTESIAIWNEVAPGVEIKKFGRKDNFWGPTGASGPCGPSSELHFKLDNGETLEIWNLVFTEYIKDETGKLTKLPVTNIDTGMGLERLSMVLNSQSSIFETDLFAPITEGLLKSTTDLNQTNEKSLRILADHGRAITFLAVDGVLPSNSEQGYILRRLLRRAVIHGHQIGFEGYFLNLLADFVIENYGLVYSELSEKEPEIKKVIMDEEAKFDKTRERGLLEFQKALGRSLDKIISGEDAFRLFDTFGFPLPLTKELAQKQGYQVDEAGFEDKYTQHRAVSKSGMEKKFKGGLEDHSDIVVRMHTATHLLHQALRDVLGDSVYQRGSNITSERLRFDFNYPEKLTDDQISAVERVVNQKVNEGLKVNREVIPFEMAKDSGAIALFKDSYGEDVSIYSIGPDYTLDPNAQDQRERAGYYSREFCGGPHVENTSEVGKFKILSQEAVGSGIRRIKAVVD